jgi:threonine/homoserine/homoserine lactone efflux protein
VATRAAASGFRHGAATSLGIVVGDILFILVAILGLALLAEVMGPAFYFVKYVAGAYLVWFGISLWRPVSGMRTGRAHGDSTLVSSFLAGLMITLGDQKAIFFYLGFLPAFVDLTSISGFEIGLVIAVTILSVGGVKLFYAYLGNRARLLTAVGVGTLINRIAGVAMIAAGLFLVFVK